MRQYYASVDLCDPEVMKDVSVGGGSELQNGLNKLILVFLFQAIK